MRCQNHLGAQLTGAFDGGVEVVDFEPQQDAVAVRMGLWITDPAVVVIDLPVMELHDQLTVGDETLVLRSAMVAVTAEQLLVPPATGFDVAYRDQRLGSHKANATYELPVTTPWPLFCSAAGTRQQRSGIIVLGGSVMGSNRPPVIGPETEGEIASACRHHRPLECIDGEVGVKARHRRRRPIVRTASQWRRIVLLGRVPMRLRISSYR